MQQQDTSQWLFDVTAAQFDERVVNAGIPVLVDFWAPWCGPCKQIAPVLENLVRHYSGQLHVAKINVDDETTLATSFGVRSIPMLALFHGGKLVEQLVGLQPEQQLKNLIDKYIESAPLAWRDAVQDALLANDYQGALAILRDVQQQQPENPEIIAAITRTQLAMGDWRDASQTLAELPEHISAEEDIRRLADEIVIARRADGVRDTAVVKSALDEKPDDLGLRLELARAAAADRDFDTALEQYMAIMRTDRNYGEDAGRTGLISVFELLGSGDTRVQQYRRQMANLIN
ncbi:MAG: thioredoxin [Pseudomonadota bacterium]